MEKCEPTREELSAKIRTLEERLWEAEQTIAAIQSGEVDALVIQKPDGEQLYTLTGADHGYRILVESVSEGALILSSDSSIYYCNRTLGEMLQLPIQKIIGRELDSYVASEGRAQLMELIKESRSLGAAKGEFPIKRVDGTILPVNVSLNRMSVEHFEGVCAVITDLSEQKQVEDELRRHRTELELLVNERTAELQREIIERKRAEEEVRGQREWLRVTLTSIGDAVIATDEAARITFINPVAAELTGWREDEARGKLVQEVLTIINEKTREPAEDVIRRVLRDGRVTLLANHTALVTRDGREIPIEDSAAPIKDSAGNVIGVVLVFHDVTERRRAQEALKQSEERLQALMTALPVGVSFSHDANCRFVTGNPAVLAQFEVAPEDNLSASAADLNAPGRQVRFFREGRKISDTELPLQRAVAENQEIPKMELEVLLPSGRRWFSEASGVPLRNAEGKVVGGVAVTVDITERKLTEEKILYQRAILETINHIFHQALTCETEEQLGVTCLKAAAELTQSKYGFIGEFDGDGSLYDISMSDPGWEACAMDDQSGHGRPKIDFKIHGLFGRVLLDGKSLLTNDPTSHPDSIGTPSGHPPLTAFLGVPLIHDGKTQGLLGLANREGGYTSEHQQAIETIAPAIIEAFFRKRLEAELRESEERLRLHRERMPIGFIVYDAEFRFLQLNPAAEQIFGYKAEELIGRHAQAIVPPDAKPHVDDILRRLAKGEMTAHSVNENLTRDGRLIFCDWLNTPLKDAQGKFLGFLSMVQDVTERKAVQEALHRSENLLRRVVDSMPIGVWISDEHGNLIVGNPVTEQIWAGKRYVGIEHFGEYKASRLDTGKPIEPDEWAIARAIRYGEITLNEELEIECFDGTRKILLNSALPVFDENKKMIAAIAVNQDITERKRVEEALRQSEARFKLLSETAGRLLTSENPQGIYLNLCRQVMEHLDCHTFFNFLVDDPSGKLHLNAWSGIPEEEARKIEWLDYGVAVCGCAARDGVRIVAEDIFNTPDVRTELVKSYGIQAYACHPLRVEGRLIGTLSFGTRTRTRFSLQELEIMRTVADQVATAMDRIRLIEELQRSRDELEIQVQKRTAELNTANEELRQEILERRHAEEAENRARTSLQNVFDGIPTPLFMIDQHLSVGMLNEAARKYFKIADDDESVGRCCHDLAFGKDSPCDRCGILLAIREGKEITFEREGPSERERIEQVTVYPLEEVVTGIPGAIVRIDDITEIKNLEKHMMRVDRLSSLGQLSGGIAHEIRNPLAGINLFVDVLNDEEKFARTSVELDILQEIKSNIKRINGIIKRVLDFSRQPETASWSKLEISSLIEDTLKFWRSRMGKEGIELRVYVEEDLPDLLGDPIEIQQVLNNLVENAIDDMRGGGLLSIAARRCTFSAEKKRPAVSITVQDSGSGIPTEAQGSVFNPFFTTKPTGTGLGLAISHRIISRHGGIIFFETSENMGTTFHIEFPVASGG